MICFDFFELRSIYEKSKKQHIAEAIKNSGVQSIGELMEPKKMHEIVDQAVERGMRSKDEVEIFATLLYAPHFFGSDSKICFKLSNNISPDKVNINSIEGLIEVIKENDLTDFAINCADGVRQFQLKRIKFSATTELLFDFLKKKIQHYGNDLGDVNLLLALQESTAIDNKMFPELNQKLRQLSFRTRAQILISYNENNQQFVMNQVYPEVTTTRVDIKSLYN